MRRAAILIAALAVLPACGPERRSEPLYGVLQLDAREARGELVYQQWCEQCHPGGEAGLGPAINDKPVPLAVIRVQIREGLGTMPSFGEGEISDEAMEALLAFIDARRDHGDD